MGYFEDFGQWERELGSSQNNERPRGNYPTAEEYLASLLPPRHGLWHLIEQQELNDKFGPTLTSFEFARGLQGQIALLPPSARSMALIDGFGELDELATDVRGQRAYLRLGDGEVSATIGGYSLFPDKEMIAMRLYELNYGISNQAGVEKSTGKRLAGPYEIPVFAVESMTQIVSSYRDRRQRE